jgi:hypothetical protein
MKTYQIKDEDGNDLGLFQTERIDEDVENDIVECFKMASEMETQDPTIDFYDAVQVYLEQENVWRLFVEEIYVDI